MKKTFYILLSIVVFSSCNEYSLVEGIKPKGSFTKLPAGTIQSKSFPTNGIRFSALVTSDLGVGKITVTLSNSFNADTKTTIIEKYYPDLTSCNNFLETTVDFDFTKEVNANRNYYLNTLCTIKYSAKAEDGTIWNGTDNVKINTCSGVSFTN